MDAVHCTIEIRDPVEVRVRVRVTVRIGESEFRSNSESVSSVDSALESGSGYGSNYTGLGSSPVLAPGWSRCRSAGSPPASWMACSGLTTSTGSVTSRTSSPYELYSLILRAAAHVISTFRSAFTDRPDGSSSTGHRVAGTRCCSSFTGHRVSPKQHRVLDTVSWRSARDTGR